MVHYIMEKITISRIIVLLGVATGLTALAEDHPPTNSTVAVAPPRVPAFSVDYMDRSVNPGTDFYHFADGQWLKNNPVPPDKSRWASFTELAERNWYLIHEILDTAALQKEPLRPHSPRREVGDFFTSVMDTNRIEKLGLKPVTDDLKKIDRIKTTKDLFALLADFHQRGLGGIFHAGFGPDSKNSSVYAVELGQGGLSHWVGMARMGEINSDWDRDVLAMFTSGQGEELASWSRDQVEAGGNGAHELRSWLTVAGAMEGHAAQVLAYEPVAAFVTGMGVLRYEVGRNGA